MSLLTVKIFQHSEYSSCKCADCFFARLYAYYGTPLLDLKHYNLEVLFPTYQKKESSRNSLSSSSTYNAKFSALHLLPLRLREELCLYTHWGSSNDIMKHVYPILLYKIKFWHPEITKQWERSMNIHDNPQHHQPGSHWRCQEHCWRRVYQRELIRYFTMYTRMQIVG